MKTPVKEDQVAEALIRSHLVDMMLLLGRSSMSKDTYFFTFHSRSGVTYGIAKKYGPRS